jgi:hypothetical protein
MVLVQEKLRQTNTKIRKNIHVVSQRESDHEINDMNVTENEQTPISSPNTCR